MNPTILIPGITGTKLVNANTSNFDVIYSGIQKFFESIYDLELKEDPNYDKSKRAIIERADIEGLAYKESINIIHRKTSSMVYIFGYDWRKSNEYNGRKLDEFVNYLSGKLKEEKFNFLTHSMGGIVFQCYLNFLNNDFSVIDKAILTVPPFKGSIEALKALIVGEGGSNFPLFNSNDEFRKIARSFPSIYELLPTYEHAVDFEGNTHLFDLYNPEHWQSNIAAKPLFLKRLEALKVFNANARYDLSSLPDGAKDKFLIIIGDGERTSTKVIIKEHDLQNRVDNFFDFDLTQPKDSDGTVPLQSSSFYKGSILTLSVKSKWYDKATHAFFLNDGRVQTIINRFLSDQTDYEEWWSMIGGSVKRI